MIRIEAISSFRQLGPRNNQEDWLAPSEPSTDDRILVLCDGMGGHGHGEVASQTVAEAVYQYLTGLSRDTYKEADIQAAADIALEALRRKNVVDSERTMGTTLVVAVFNKMKILIGHIGDSRAYLFDANGRVKFRTADHSRVAEAVANGILTEEEAFNSPYKNIITRAMLADTEQVDAEIDELTIEDGDILMLCSDGVNDCLRDRQLEEAFIAFDFAGACDAIGRQCDASSADNNTAIVARLSQDEENVAEPVVEEAHTARPATESTGRGTGATVTGATDNCDHPAYCPNCGSPLEACVQFCPHCGHKLSRRSTCRFCHTLDNALEFIEEGIHKIRRKIRGTDV